MVRRVYPGKTDGGHRRRGWSGRPLGKPRAASSSDQVVRLALQRAASVAALLITTEVMVAEKTYKTSPMLNGGMAAAGF